MGVVFVGLTCLLVLFTCVLWVFRRRKEEAWRKAGVPFLKPWPILGNYAPYILQQKISGLVAQEICRIFPDAPCIGTYYGTEPALLIQDPELIKTVLLKDFIYFNGREISAYTDREIVTRNMFFTYGDRWKVVRQNITPLFTAAKIRGMFKHIKNCIFMLEDLLEHETGSSDIVDIKLCMTKYTMDNIGSIVFGVDTNTLAIDYDPNNPYMKIGKLIFDNSSIRGFAVVTRAIWPAIFYGLGLKVFPDAVSQFFHQLLIKVFESRNYEPSSRNDFVDILLNLKKLDTIECESMMEEGTVRMNLDDDFMVSQCVLLFGAGFETSSSTLSFALFELAKNQEAQDKAIEEIDAWLKVNNNQLDYSCVSGLPYLQACVEETLRLYTVFPLLTRETMADHELAGMKVRKGTRIHIPVYHMQHREEFYPEPLKFKPERFLDENRQSIPPFTYMPFGEGNRICVGVRVAKMAMIPGLMTVLKRYRVKLAPGMPDTLTLDPRAISAQVKGDINLKFIPRRDLNQAKYTRA